MVDISLSQAEVVVAMGASSAARTPERDHWFCRGIVGMVLPRRKETTEARRLVILHQCIKKHIGEYPLFVQDFAPNSAFTSPFSANFEFSAKRVLCY